MSIECSECEMAARAGHLESCSRFDKLTAIEERWELVSLYRGRLKDCADVTWLATEVRRLRELVAEIKSCGHNSDCPAGVSDAYRCRCHYGIILESEQRTAQSDSHAEPAASPDSAL